MFQAEARPNRLRAIRLNDSLFLKDLNEVSLDSLHLVEIQDTAKEQVPVFLKAVVQAIGIEQVRIRTLELVKQHFGHHLSLVTLVLFANHPIAGLGVNDTDHNTDQSKLDNSGTSVICL